MSTFKRDILLATVLATITASVNRLHVLFAQLRLVPAQAQAIEAITISGPVAPDGKTDVTCDLPTSERIKNIGSRVDGAGMCVDSSFEMAAHWAGLEELRGFRDWAARKPGGGYPEKVAQQVRQYCEEKKIPQHDCVQYSSGGNPALIEQALQTVPIACVTYGGADGVRHRGPIAHMVCCVCYGEWCCILDTNAIGDNELIWTTKTDFLKRWTMNGGSRAFVWLAPSRGRAGFFIANGTNLG